MRKSAAPTGKPFSRRTHKLLGLVLMALTLAMVLPASASATAKDDKGMDARLALENPDDWLPGVPLPASPFGGVVGGGDPGDVYSVYLREGDTFRAIETRGGMTDIDIALFPSGTTDISTSEDAVAVSAGIWDTENFDYTVPTGAAGTYYLYVWPNLGVNAYSDSYTLQWYMHSPTSDDSLPGAPLPASPTRGVVGDGNLQDIFNVNLGVGDTIKVSLTGSGLGENDALLFPPGTTDVSYWSDWVAEATVYGGEGYPKTLAYTVPAGAGGTYYLNVLPTSGWLPEPESYTLTYSVRAPLFTPTITLKLGGLRSGAVTFGRRVTARGLVTPTTLAGTNAALTVQRKTGIRWVKVKTVTRTISSTMAYSWKYKPLKRGAYRVQAKIARTAAHTAAKTVWRTFKVK